jgi:RHS repeat-associated protein
MTGGRGSRLVLGGLVCLALAVGGGLSGPASRGGGAAGRGSDQVWSSAYSWDSQARLAGVTLPEVGGDGAASPVSSTLGGLLTTLDTGTALAHETATGRLVSATAADGATTTFAHDLVGARVSETVGGAVARQYSWDQAGNLAQVAGADGSAVSYAYDAAGLLRTRAESGADGRPAGDSAGFVWDTSRAVPTMLTDGDHWFVYGLGSAPLAQHPVNAGPPGSGAAASSTSLFLHGDLAGSIRAVTDKGGDVAAGSDWTAYGQAVPVARLVPVTTANRFGYAGEWADPATGLVYLRARWLDPATGLFLSVDPAGSATGDAYGYAAGNPVQLTDPLGLFAVLVGLFLLLPRDTAQEVANFHYGALDGVPGRRDHYGFGVGEAGRQTGRQTRRQGDRQSRRPHRRAQSHGGRGECVERCPRRDQEPRQEG